MNQEELDLFKRTAYSIWLTERTQNTFMAKSVL